MEIGGKAYALEKLRSAGFQVPPFFICDPNWSDEKIIAKIDELLPDAIFFAVRSSAKDEDSAKQSFAGHFYSGIGIARERVPSEVVKVNESYKKTKGGIIVQEFIASESAGVMFTEVGKETVVINATIGLCRPVVNGKECDEYLLSKNGVIVRKSIPPEKPILLFNGGEIVSGKSDKESIDPATINRLIKLGAEIQACFGSPQDVEWCFKDGDLYVLQSRPITRDFKLGKEEYFDSANIAESYSGIVLPLTCSFAKMVYEQVYKDLLNMSGVSRKKIERHSDIFENLLGFFYGRMYYNMNNWYRMAEFVPGYSRNKQNFELMISSNIKQDIVTVIKPSLALKILYPTIVAFKVALFGLTSASFKSSVVKHLRSLRNQNFDQLSYQESIVLFNDLNKNLLRKWYITLENDFFVMTYLGILKKLLGEEVLQKAIIFPSKATEQVNALASLSKQMSEVKELWQAIESDSVEKFNAELAHHGKILATLDSYLYEFGGRFASELKLESIGVDEDTKKLLAVLRAYRTYKPKSYVASLNIQLPISRKLAAKVVLSKFKKYASRREEFRLLRSNTFAMARRLFRHMGSLLADRGAIDHAEDVFYLRMDEILDPTAETRKDIIETIEKRKKEYNFYKKVTPPPHFSTIDNQPPAIAASTASKHKTIHARPASPGIAKGRVRVFREFSMPAQPDFDILVTSHTDPGWTSLIALSKGLIIEHGGVLSHASIVARELGIPAVIGATSAVDTLTDYQMVEINGSTGIVKLF